LQGLVIPVQLALHLPEPLSHLATWPAVAGQSLSWQQLASGMHLPLQLLLPDGHAALHVWVDWSQVTT
jgi:hypothetical protein